MWVSYQLNITAICNATEGTWSLWLTEVDSHGDWELVGYVLGDKRYAEEFLHLFQRARANTRPIPDPPIRKKKRR